eukprot:gene19067-25671_t
MPPSDVFTQPPFDPADLHRIAIYAAQGDAELLVDAIESDEFNPNVKEGTALRYAANYGQTEIVKILVKTYSVPLDLPNEEGYNAMCLAIQMGHKDIAQYLKAAGSDMTYRTPLGWTLLHIAAWWNQPEMIQWLADCGGDVFAENRHGVRPFDITRPGRCRVMLHDLEGSKGVTAEQH